jgi:hypothetical protein
MIRPRPLRPWLLITMTSAFCIWAASTMAGPGGPYQTWVSTRPTPAFSSLSFTPAR